MPRIVHTLSTRNFHSDQSFSSPVNVGGLSNPLRSRILPAVSAKADVFAGPVTGGIVGIGCVAACELCDPTWFQSPLLLDVVIVVHRTSAALIDGWSSSAGGQRIFWTLPGAGSPPPLLSRGSSGHTLRLLL